MNTLTILAIILSILGVGLSFWLTLAGVLISYGAIVCTCFCGVGGEVIISHDSLLFWGVATVIVLGLTMLNSDNPFIKPVSRAYVLGGAIVGALLGFAAVPSPGYEIIGAAIGTLLGAFAYSRTPAGRGFRGNNRLFIDYVCACGLPAVVIVGMSASALTAIFF